MGCGEVLSLTESFSVGQVKDDSVKFSRGSQMAEGKPKVPAGGADMKILSVFNWIFNDIYIYMYLFICVCY